MSTCAACEAEMDVDEFDVDRGDELSCPECGANLEVVEVSPVEFEVVSDEAQVQDDDIRHDEEEDLGDEDDASLD